MWITDRWTSSVWSNDRVDNTSSMSVWYEMFLPSM